MKGWISLHRQIGEHWLWQEKPFSRGQAWIDLLMLANHKSNKFLLGNELMEINEGSLITSQSKLMDRWGWGNTKVRNFLKLLNEENMLEFSGKKYTLIKILNYEIYQKQTDLNKVTTSDVGEEQITSNSSTTCEQLVSNLSANTNNNVNNVNNVNKNKYIVFFDTYNNQNIISHKTLTSKMKQAINRALNKNSEEDILETIKRYGIAFKDPDYKFCKYKMTLDKFLTQNNGYYDWLDEGQKWINYNDFKKGVNANKDTQQSNHKTKFHLVKSRGDDYTADELENLILSNQKRKRVGG